MTYANIPMPMEEANAMVESYNLSGRTARAVRLFLLGVCATRSNAAVVAGVHQKAIDRALARMDKVTRKCGCCGTALTTLMLRPPKDDDDDDSKN